MKKLTLQEQNRQEFLDYSKEWIDRNSTYKNYNYLTESILNNTFTFFTNNKLTALENGSTYWIRNGKKEIESFGYSGSSAGDMDTKEEMLHNLLHQVFCKAEWIARSKKENYSETCKSTIGIKHYNTIIA